MRHFQFGTSLLLLAAVSCSSYEYVSVKPQSSSTAAAYRSVASKKAIKLGEDVKNDITDLTRNIFHSYLLGQVLLEKFDENLEASENPLKSEEYNQLLAIRNLVDHFEEEVNELYLDLVLVTALPDYSAEQKQRAQDALVQIGNFLKGITSKGSELPENLKPLILGNITHKQTDLYEQLKAIHDGAALGAGISAESRSIIYENMVLLRATRRLYNRELANYQVDSSVLRSAVEEESKKSSFKKYEKQVKKLAKKISAYRDEVKTGRSTSSDVFFPSTGSAGNITGNGFPRNTWSLTYDDGPGSKTTPQVLANLKARDMKATFFVLAKQAEAMPTIMRNLTEAGMDMASHSYTHPQLTKLGNQGLHKEIATSKTVIESKTGKTVKLFRLPYGAGVSNANIRSKIAGENMIHVFWNVDTLDWQDKNPRSILNRSLKQMAKTKNNSGVILFHDIHQQSVTASTLLMDHLKSTNATVCTVQGVVDQINKNLSSCK